MAIFSITGYKSATIICYKIMRSKGRSFAMNIISWMGDDRGNTSGPHCEGMGGVRLMLRFRSH